MFPLTVGDQTVHSAGNKTTTVTTEITETLISEVPWQMTTGRTERW